MHSTSTPFSTARRILLDCLIEVSSSRKIVQPGSLGKDTFFFFFIGGGDGSGREEEWEGKTTLTFMSE